MKYLRDHPSVQALENFERIGVETPENEGIHDQLFDEAIEASFGVSYDAIPSWFFEEEEPWENAVHLLSWGRERGYDLSDEYGALLLNAEHFAYVIEAIERDVVTASEDLLRQHADKAWASRLENEATDFLRRPKR